MAISPDGSLEEELFIFQMPRGPVPPVGTHLLLLQGVWVLAVVLVAVASNPLTKTRQPISPGVDSN